MVWLLGFASFANDVSSEAIFPLLPLYLAELGGGVGLLGLIEGSADAVSSGVKVLAGRWSDRGPRRLLVVGGYGLPALARAGIAAALAPWHVLLARLTDRVGKGIRSGPRDALLADAVAEESAGRAFGVQRSLDHLGAAVGPLVASGLLLALAALPQERALRATFAVAAALGLVAPALVLLGLRPGGSSTSTATATGKRNANADAADRPLSGAFWRYLACAAIFALANSSDAFLLRKAHDVGYTAAQVPLLWFGHHLVKALAGAPGGALSDRLPRAWVVAGGWVAYGLAYLGFSAANARWQVAALFGFYALYHGLAEAAERALVADAADRGARGRAYGWYHGVTGAVALPASVLTGWLWSTRGAGEALATSGALALLAAGVLTLSAWGGRLGRAA
ncbi:MFS transporter [Anaeromyxobacter diazotrophicus]|uniref:MFS transporter n=1 Tax=Anaeromyxobacter diazotrophicus TaxID=2590199 RepID=A0A7I9VQE5_9BACT|nr:MFS transporter [Anaeromyxobacter diazotrophicus]GEJ58309.1 MFS transporter [Anaeromyxobacter diazotrophicus]